jgi:cyclic pyranopterin phosphate synthase
MPLDRFGRQINYLRLSLIDHCNLRCVYCMPLRGLSFVPGHELLTPSELELVVQAAADVGFHKIRLTGGEPTLRADLVEIVERVSRVEGITDVALTRMRFYYPAWPRPSARPGSLA